MSIQETIFIDIRGNGHLLADGVERLSGYSETEIIFSAGSMNIHINGVGLTLDHMSERKIGIRGKIHSVTYEDCNVE